MEPYRDKKVVGVFVRFFRAASADEAVNRRYFDKIAGY
jgi:hypothetical protein